MSDSFSIIAKTGSMYRDIYENKAFSVYNIKQYQAYKQNTSFARRVFHASIGLAQLIIESIDDGIAWLITEPSRHPTDEERLEAALNYVASQ